MLKEYLTSIADSIRAKLDTTEKINAQDYADKISEVYDVGYAKGAEENSGGGAELARSIVDGTITEYVDEEITSIKDYTFYKCNTLARVDLPLVTMLGSNTFYECGNLEFINIPLTTGIGGNGFRSCKKIGVADFPLATSVGNYAFYQCSALTTINMPSVTTIGSNGFYNCLNLKFMDFYSLEKIGSYAFNSGGLTTLILRKSDGICVLDATNALASTGISKGTGYIYVPSALIDTYKSATNWSTYAAQFRALEDYTVDGTITGELDESKI